MIIIDAYYRALQDPKMVHESSRRKMQCSVEFGVKYILLYSEGVVFVVVVCVFLCVFFGACLLSFIRV